MFVVQLSVYFEGMDPAEEHASPLMVPKEEQVGDGGVNTSYMVACTQLWCVLQTAGFCA